VEEQATGNSITYNDPDSNFMFLLGIEAGMDSGTSAKFIGSIYELSLWGTALTKAEIY